YWWQAYEPVAGEPAELPRQAAVAIIGAGYTGLACALELAKQGIEAVVLEAHAPGWGASTRNGGMVSGGASVGKRYSGKDAPARLASLRADAGESFKLTERLIEEENIACEWTKAGGFVAAWCQAHFDALQAKADDLNSGPELQAYVVPRARQREEIGSDYYYGGLVVRRAAHLHPAQYFKGLLDACRRRGVRICAEAPVRRLARNGVGWTVETARGTLDAGEIVVASNGYTGDVTPDLMARVIPVGSYIIATEELAEDIARTLMPNNRSVYDTRRVLTYYRMTGNGKRLIFGGRAKFGHFDPVETAPILYRLMTDRFPQLDGVKITHAWTGSLAFTFDETPHMGKRKGVHFALGCNGSGVAMMTYLGTQVARKLAGANAPCAFDSDEFPGHWAYSGNPWFVPWFGRYLRLRDWLDRTLR
ncbi:MAG TPA: FAD-dependent oxidoreductase, partial [Aestuariivirgaceae bacterium]|nr:FAD-dependent oxidoreductase [Aestuariivirgaceae bacterium]